MANHKTTTSVVSSPNPSVIGQSVTVTVTVSAPADPAATPRGVVKLYLGSRQLGREKRLARGTASWTVTSLPPGHNELAAVFEAAAGFADSGSALQQVVEKDATTTTLTSSDARAVCGESLTFTAKVSAATQGGATPTGSVQFTVDGGNPIGPVQLDASGAATSPPVSGLTAGTHKVTVGYSGDASFLPSNEQLAQPVVRATTQTVVTTSVAQSFFGQPVDVTAVVTPVAPGTLTPTGGVQFRIDDANADAPVALDATGRATLPQVDSLLPGDHKIVAAYLDDANSAPSVSQPVWLTVTAAPTTTVLVEPADGTVFGQEVTLTALVTPVTPGAGTPTGVVSFFDGRKQIGTAAVAADGTATVSVSALGAGSHTITASYGGDSRFSGITSAPLAHAVNPVETATAIRSAANPATLSQQVSFVATVSAVRPGTSTPDGAVQFSVNGKPFGPPVPLIDGEATVVASPALGAGLHGVTASYSGSAGFRASDSPALTQRIEHVPAGYAGGNGYLQSLRDISAFPLLTEEVSLPSAPSGLGGGGGEDVGQRAFAAVRDVLGWRPKPDDPRGFKAALEQSFQLSETEGHIAWTYTPRGYAMAADMGAVTGAQASLLNRARSAVDMARPLIVSLTPLSAIAVPAEYEPIRRMVLGEMEGLVSELAQEGGPRTQKVDDLFRQLLGSDIVNDRALANTQSMDGTDPVEAGLLYGIRVRQLIRKGDPIERNAVQAQGHLYTLQQRMGLNRNEVNTVEDERIVSNFMTGEDAIFSLWVAWWQERRAFGRIQTDGLRLEPFLGTQLVLVSRSLGVVAEAVQELYFALDSVFVGPPERETIRLEFPDAPALYLSELLQWVDDVASTTGPRYVQDAGKDGVIAITQTLRAVRHAVAGTVALVHERPPSPAMAAPRVVFALRKLDSQLGELVGLTDKFSRTFRAEKEWEAPPPTPMFAGLDIHRGAVSRAGDGKQ